jgi:hypothetical protein
MEKVFLHFGSGMVELTDQNESEIKHFLYSNFDGDKMLKILDENGKTIDKLKLEDIFTKPDKK